MDIQDNCVVHADEDAFYGDYVTLGHGVTCHARNINSNCLIGNGATLNDGVEIGEFSIIAAGCMVVDDMQIAARSMVMGIPARIRGEVEERHLELIRRTAAAYARKAQRYKEQGGLEAERLD